MDLWESKGFSKPPPNANPTPKENPAGIGTCIGGVRLKISMAECKGDPNTKLPKMTYKSYTFLLPFLSTPPLMTENPQKTVGQ